MWWCVESASGEDAVIGDGVKLHSHVVIEGHTSLGAGCEVYPFAAIGCAPQHTLYENEPSRLVVGKNCVIREHVTMHPGTAIDAMETIIGDHGLFFAGAHVAHDCVIGNNGRSYYNFQINMLTGKQTLRQRFTNADNIRQNIF